MSPTAPDGKVCRDCKWCDGSNCHRYPPQMVPWPDNDKSETHAPLGVFYAPLATFPFVGPNDWCGEWSKGK